LKILVVDVGGTHVKILATGQKQKREFVSGPKMTALRMVADVKKLAKDWAYDVVSIGFPGPVLHGRPVAEPHNLGCGWTGFNFASAFGLPVRVANDAAMQALGSYRGGRMLFLGLGTGLGSAMIVNGIVEPMELGHLPYKKGTYEDYVGDRGLDHDGKKRWRKLVTDVIERLVAATEPEGVVIGGGNLVHLKKLPKGYRAGNNAYAFIGGFRMWDSGSGPNNRGREKTKRLVRRIGARRLESLTCRNHSENCGPRTDEP
jgi:polyphosphate glucokinase